MTQTPALTRAGWLLSMLFALFMLGASVAPKLAGMAVAVDALRGVGWGAGWARPIGPLELGLTLLYLLPATRILGAVLLTGLLGAAVAAQLRVGAPPLSHALFGTYLGLAMWGGLWLRDPRLRALFPWVGGSANRPG